MRTFSLRTLAVATLIAVSGTSFAQKGAPTLSDAQTDALVKSLESSGKLDAAIDRGIERRIQRDIAERQRAGNEQARQRALLAKNARKIDPKVDRMYGNTQAPYSLIVYSDMECPYCQEFNGIGEAAAKDSKGEVNMVFRHLPLPQIHPNAIYMAKVAHCVSQFGPEKDESFYEFLGEALPKLKASRSEFAKPENISAYLKDKKWNESAILTCANGAEASKVVSADMEDAKKAGVSGTPGVLLRNNKTGDTVIVGGYVPLQAVQLAIEQFKSGTTPNTNLPKK